MLKPLIPKLITFILSRLKNAGHQAYIVGGAVRDVCISRPVMDWDVATSARREEIKTLFGDMRLFALKRGTVTLVDSGRHFQVTPFRGSKKRIEDDLALRDFTINAMAYDSDKNEILDPFGGRKDISRRLVKTTGVSESRFKEDPLRLLRAVRLATELRFNIDASTRGKITEMAPMLRLVSSERIREELMRILMSPKPSKGFNVMQRTGLLRYFLPELLEGYLKRQNSHHRYTIFKHVMETVDTVKPSPALRLTALLHDIAKPRLRKKIDGTWRFHKHEAASASLAEKVMRRLRFSRDMIVKVTNLIRYHMISYDSEWSDGAVRRLIRRVGQGRIMDLIAFRQADLLAHGLHDQNQNLLTELKERIEKLSEEQIALTTHDLAISGHKVMEVLGISPGPNVGNILKELLETVTDNPALNTEKDLVATLLSMEKT